MLLGRKKEIAWLRDHWRDVTGHNGVAAGPRVVVLLGETGLGKSAIVQGFFESLRGDPDWGSGDPPYWGTMRSAPGAEMRFFPTVHEPDGDVLPRFLWLGVRWALPDARNRREASSELPQLRAQVDAHLESLYRRIPRWKARMGAVVDDAREGKLRWAGGIALKLLASTLLPAAVGLAADGISAMLKGSSEDRLQPVDDVLRRLRLGSGTERQRLPVILWLDDAQWMDGEVLDFVRRLLDEAHRVSWPLLVIATHWEREWRMTLADLASSPLGTTAPGAMVRAFAPLALHWKADARVIEPAARDDLHHLLSVRFPGLTPSQQTKLLDKAAGNFLTMVENLAELERRPRCFVNADSSGPLSTFGERHVESWESERAGRIAQRFRDIEPAELQDLLAIGAAVGTSFPIEATAECFAELFDEPVERSRDRLHDVIQRYAILERIDDALVGFRDQMFASVAAQHFDRQLADHREVFSRAIERQVAAYVSARFAAGGARWFDELESWTTVERSAASRLLQIGLSEAERLTTDLAAPSRWHLVRWHALRLLLAAFDQRWEEVARHQGVLQSVPWTLLPSEVVDEPLRLRLARVGSGRQSATIALAILDAMVAPPSLDPDAPTLGEKVIATAQLDRATRLVELGDHASAAVAISAAIPLLERLVADQPTREHRRLLLRALYRQVHLSGLRDEIEESAAYNRRAVAMAQEWRAAGDVDPILDVFVSMCLTDRGRRLLRAGRIDEALELLEQSIRLLRATEDIASEDADRDAIVSSLVYALDAGAECREKLGDRFGARLGAETAVEMRRKRSDLAPSPQARFDLAYSLNRLVDFYVRGGDIDAAQRSNEEALAIARALSFELDTHRAWRNLSFALIAKAALDQRRHGPEPGIVSLLEEVVQSRRRCLELLGTPMARYELVEGYTLLSKALHALGRIEQARQASTAALSLAQPLSVDTLRRTDVRGAQLLEECIAWSRDLTDGDPTRG